MKRGCDALVTDYQLDEIGDAFIDAIWTKLAKKKPEEQLRVENPPLRTEDLQYSHITYRYYLSVHTYR